MIAPRYIPVVLKQVWRHRTRSTLTALGVGVSMFMFVAVQTMQRSVERATSRSRGDTTLIVYRENRFCPATSRLPDWYAPRIARVPGVASVTPMKVVVNTCSTSLDVVTFRGVPVEAIDDLARAWTIAGGSVEAWRTRSDAALVGESLARRRGLSAGDAFDAAGVRVWVAGVLRSPRPEDENVAYVPLAFLQRASSKGGLGIVTQFNVRVSDPDDLESVARAIDDEFAGEREPTHTRPERAFVAQAGADIVEIVSFTRTLGWGCLAAMLALVANSIVLSVRDRVREHAVMQTLGYRPGLLARLILIEGLVLSLAGGLAGAIPAYALIARGSIAFYTEGLNVPIEADPATFGIALALAGGAGIAAGLLPAWSASRREIAGCFRAV